MFQIKFSIYAVILLVLIQLLEECGAQRNQKNSGSYIPELYGANLGKYKPDDRGKYRHVAMPYTGGYGDRGSLYQQNEKVQTNTQRRPPDIKKEYTVVLKPTTAPIEQPFTLGPRDHLRFSIDFNYNGSGWQVIEFDWIRDDEGDQHSPQINYESQNKLWETGETETGIATVDDEFTGYQYEQGDSNTDQNVYNEEPDQETQAPIDEVDTIYVVEEYDSNSGDNTNANQYALHTAADSANVKDTIAEVLNYVITNILPTLS